MKLAKVLSALSYAHLLGISASKAEDDEKKQRADESDEDYAKRMEEDDKKEKEDDAKKAEGDDTDAKADEGDDESDDDKKDDKAKKAEESDDEDDKKKATRQSERARCAAIFACAAAATRPDMAAHLAFHTDMTAEAATDMLKAISVGHVGKTRSLANRMAEVQTPNVGTEAGAAPAADSPQGVAARIVAAGKMRRGES
jgi:archaellum component FlaD/FlaE